MEIVIFAVVVAVIIAGVAFFQKNAATQKALIAIAMVLPLAALVAVGAGVDLLPELNTGGMPNLMDNTDTGWN